MILHRLDIPAAYMCDISLPVFLTIEAFIFYFPAFSSRSR
jgi:hypothetical protein